MEFKIPFTFNKLEVLKKRSVNFTCLVKLKESKVEEYLLAAGVSDIGWKHYIAICYRNFFINFLILTFLSVTILGINSMDNFFLYGLLVGLGISLFLFINQYNYPRIYSGNIAKEIERNLISALQDMKVQLNSGIPLFSIMVNLGESNYGAVSGQFKKIVKEINSGVPEVEAIEHFGKTNTSPYFRRVLWQVSNGLRAGSDMGIVINQEISNLTNEQTIQIQNYGSRLNPLIMFYMLIAVILPSLGLTFFIILSSLLDLSEGFVKVLFLTIFGLVILLQIMFMGIIKSRRPSLL
jgi:flagellar protein FlaJ